MSDRAIVTGHCPDQKGLVATITRWLTELDGNILHLDQHVDRTIGRFFIRVEWDLDGFCLPAGEIAAKFAANIAQPIELDYRLSFASTRLRMALFVSKEGHCLWDILSRCQSGEWQIDIPLIISNHPTFREVAQQFGIAYHEIPVTHDAKAEQEARQLALLEEHQVDFAVLARYMQILSDSFLSKFTRPVINIHHSFLPAFAGAKPYHQAYDRGVKIIGATAHYVTPQLDEGPIIDQETARVSHRDPVNEMIRKGKDLEKLVLSRAIHLHLNQQVIVHGNRTVVFH